MTPVVIDLISWFVSCSVLITDSVSYQVSILYNPDLSNLLKLSLSHSMLLWYSAELGPPYLSYYLPGQGKACDRMGISTCQLGMLVASEVVL